jgi:hypothetical protein
MKSVLLFVVSVLSVVQSDNFTGLLVVHENMTYYVVCDITPVASQTCFVFIFFPGPCRGGTSNTCVGLRRINLRTEKKGNPREVYHRCVAYSKPNLQADYMVWER